MSDAPVTLSRNENQALGMGRYAIDFLAGKFDRPDESVLARLEQFHVDSVGCAVSALAGGTRAPNVLRSEALDCAVPAGRAGATCFGSPVEVQPEKAVAANSAAAREWDANGTNFGFNPQRGATCGEFGHNDFYPVAIAAAQLAGRDGRQTLLAMLALDEIRGRLAEVFALKNYKIDHVVHGGIASAAVFGALVGATAEQIESAIGLLIAHYVPFRAIRAGKQLSDSKGASAALHAEMAVLSVRRAMRGFRGPADIFRNPQALFCLFEKPAGEDQSPFDLTLSTSGSDFAVMGMHFKLGLYEHQSAGAIAGLMQLLDANPEITESPEAIEKITIEIYEPALSIIGDPAKRDPRTRQSADHSMVYIIGTLLRKAIEQRRTSWRELMLMPEDYDEPALHHPLTRRLMEKIDFQHGGPDYDARYPEGIPTTIGIQLAGRDRLSSGLVLYPKGHARCPDADVDELLAEKFNRLASGAVDDPSALRARFADLGSKSPREVAQLNDFPILGLDA